VRLAELGIVAAGSQRATIIICPGVDRGAADGDDRAHPIQLCDSFVLVTEVGAIGLFTMPGLSRGYSLSFGIGLPCGSDLGYWVSRSRSSRICLSAMCSKRSA
jgi:hypothetical protein